MSSLQFTFEKRRLKTGETPQVFFEAVRSEYAFLMESGQNLSVVGNGLGRQERIRSARYSYIGFDPFRVLRSDDRDFLKKKPAEVLKKMRKILKHYELKGRTLLPFFGGAAGYFSYDFGVKLMGSEQKTVDDLKIPDFIFGLYDQLIVFDHVKNELYFLALAKTKKQADEKLKILKKRLATGWKICSAQQFSKTSTLRRVHKVVSNLSYRQYAKKIAEIHEKLLDGETYQINFSQRFEVKSEIDPWIFYKKMMTENPVSFATYFEFPDFQIVSISPELLLRKRRQKLETWPIKGTIARGKNALQDRQNRAALLDSEKNEAELTMIVDLERNDFGKVCKVGTVKILGHREISQYAHLFHTISRIGGTLMDGLDFFDAFQAVFPGGSITGCPKRRSIQIIDQLEQYRRGVYTGSAGFISFSGDSDFNILIRTAVVKNGKIYYQAGGGIVADSTAKEEFAETLVKARGVLMGEFQMNK